MVKAATKSGMLSRTGRGLPPPPSRDAFTLSDPHALATGSGLPATAPIFPSPHASLARHRDCSRNPIRESPSPPSPYPAAPAGQGRRERRENGMVSPELSVQDLKRNRCE